MSLIKLLGKTNIQGKTIFETAPAGYSPTDANAISYIAAVEAADGQALETPVKQAIENFIVGCKSDGIWTALKASCILAGARTLNGALVPLVGSSPTNNNFVSADYNRKTGLVGNGSTKYLNSNRNNNADLQNSSHASVWLTNLGASSLQTYLGCGAGTDVGTNQLMRNNNTVGISSGLQTRNRGSGTNFNVSVMNNVGFAGMSRNNSSNYIIRRDLTSTTITSTSESRFNGNMLVFARGTVASPVTFADGRLSFYSIGESIDLAALDTRVSALMTALNASI